MVRPKCLGEISSCNQLHLVGFKKVIVNGSCSNKNIILGFDFVCHHQGVYSSRALVAQKK